MRRRMPSTASCGARSGSVGGGSGTREGNDGGNISPKIYLVKTEDVTSLGETNIQFKDKVNFTLLEEEWEDIISSYVQKSNYVHNPVNLTVKSLDATSFHPDENKVMLKVKFNNPQELGLNKDVVDRLFVGLNSSYPLDKLYLNSTDSARRRLYEKQYEPD